MMFLSNLFAAAALAQHFSSGEKKIDLLELYTSEGCSSCPPAEAWVTDLVDHPQLFKSFVPIAMHVTYWDRLGWRDRYGSSRYDKRQRLHHAQGHSRSVYTPGFFVAGDEWRGWFARPALAMDKPRDLVGELVMHVNEEGVELDFYAAQATEFVRPMTAHLVLLGFGLQSDIYSGENKGERLEHNFVALQHQHQLPARARRQDDQPRSKKASHKNDSTQWTFKPLALSANDQHLKNESDDKQRLAFVAWVQADDDITPLQVVGGWLSP